MKKIIFKDGKFDSIIVLNTLIQDIKIFNKIKSIPILAADGAGSSLLKIGIKPDFIIGDLDSYNSDFQEVISFPSEKLIKIQEQETNDFEKTLNFALKKGFHNILIIGIHGGDYEHSLNNWSVFSKFSKKMNLTMLENNRYGFCADFSFILETNVNEIISLIPIRETKMSTNGLKWELSNETLELGKREGARNIAISDFIKIDFEFGELFVFCNSHFPKIRICK